MRGARDIVVPGGAAGGGGNINISVPGSSVNLTNVVFSNSNGVTFGLNGSTITASVGAAGGGLTNINVSAGTTSQNLSNIVYSNSNGVSFGLNGSTITATVQTNYLTTAMLSNAVTLSNVKMSAGTKSALRSDFTLVDSNGISFGLDAAGNFTATVKTDYQTSGAYLTTAMLSNAATISNIKVSAGTRSETRSDLTFADSNGISFGLTNGTITATVKTDYQTSGAYLTTAMLSNAATISNINVSAGTTSQNLSAITFSNGSGVSFGLNGSVITASVAAAGGAQTGISGIVVSDTTYTSGTVSFSNQANITIGSSVNGATQYIRLSGNPAQTNQSAIKGLGVSNTGQTAGNTGISTGIDWVLAGSQSITLSQSTAGGGPNTIWFQHPAWLTTAMQSNAATISNVNISAGTTSNNLSNWVYSNSNGVSFGLNGSTITASVAAAGGAQTAISGIVVSDTTYTSGTVSFSNQNGVTIGSSVNGATQYIRLSVATNYQSQAAYLTTAALSGDTSKYVQNWKLTGNTAGTTSSAQGTDLWFSGGNSITVSGNSNTIVFSVGAYITTADLSANSSKYVQNWKLTGNTAGTTSSAQGTDLWISGGNNVTVSGNSNTIVISAFNQSNQTMGWYAVGNTTSSASSTTLDARTISINALGGISAGYSNGSVQISAPPVTQLTGINGISLSSAGSTISIMPQWVSSYENMPEGFNATMTFNAASISHAIAFQVPQPISASFLRIPVLMTTNSTTIATMASATASANGELYSTWNAVVYSMGVGANSKSLQSVTSSSAGFTFRNSISITNSTQYSITQGFSAQALGAGTTRTTQYSISNTNYSFTTNQIGTEWSSNRMLDINWANSLSPGNYWLVIGYSSSTATSGAAGLAALTNCNVRYSNHYGISMSDISFAIMGSTNQTSGGLMGAGSFSTAGGGTTNSIPISAISSLASNIRPYFQLLRSV